MPALKKHRLIFVWTLGLDLAGESVEIFEDTVMKCAQKKEAGIFNGNTRWGYQGNELMKLY